MGVCVCFVYGFGYLFGFLNFSWARVLGWKGFRVWGGSILTSHHKVKKDALSP